MRTVIPHEMKREKTITLIALIGVHLFIGCVSNKISIRSNDSNNYTSRTYLFLGNSFAEKYSSKIEMANIAWRDSIKNNLLVFREYPKYQGEFRRIENYEYDENGDLKRQIIKTYYYHGEAKDSTIYKKIDLNTLEIVKYTTGENHFKEIHRTSNDTVYIDEIINGKYGFTSMEFWETKFRKQSQIVKPEFSNVINTFVYNEIGDLVEIERYENGNFVRKTMSINYNYDSQNRIVLKETFYGEADERKLGSTEITIYD